MSISPQMAAAAAAAIITIFTFCDDAGPPQGLRVSSGDFLFGDVSPLHSCLAEAVRDVNTPRMDTDDVYSDVTANLTFFQWSHYRDVQLCGRNQAPPGTTYNGGVEEGFASTLSGYCCYLDTQTSTESFLRIRKAGASMVSGSRFPVTFGTDLLYTLKLELLGQDITCSMLSHDVIGAPRLLATLAASDDEFTSGGIAFMPYNVRSTKKACNSSTMAILAPIALLCHECYAHYLLSWRNLHC